MILIDTEDVPEIYKDAIKRCAFGQILFRREENSPYIRFFGRKDDGSSFCHRMDESNFLRDFPTYKKNFQNEKLLIDMLNTGKILEAYDELKIELFREIEKLNHDNTN